MIKLLLTFLLSCFLTSCAWAATNYCNDGSVIVCQPMHVDENPITDAGALHHNGTLDSAGNPARVTTAPTGYTAGSYDFSSDKITFGDHNDFSSEIGASGVLTVVAWVQADTLDSTTGVRNWIVTKGAGSNYEYTLNVIGGGGGVTTVNANIWDASGVNHMVVTGSRQIDAGTWYHVAFTYNRATPSIKVYVYGSLDRSSTSIQGGGTPTNGTAALLLGKRGDDATSPWDGQIAEFAMFSRELSATEILEIANNGLQGTADWPGVPAVTNQTWYVRPDGGTTATCDGHHDAAVSGAVDGSDSGSLPDCAYDSPLWAIKFNGNGTSAFVGGDTMIIDGVANAEYEIGSTAAGAGSGSECNTTFSYDCRWIIPGGPSSAQPTRILGKGFDTDSGPRPTLYGTGGIYWGVMYFTEDDNVEIQNINITDHATCMAGPNHVSVQCANGSGADAGARNAIYSKNGNNFLIKNVRLSGLASRGVFFPGASNWTFNNVDIYGNGFAGLDNDLDSGSTSDQLTGTFSWTGGSVSYSGCIENYPSTNTIKNGSCVGQGGIDQYYQGYGDAFGFSNGTIGDWTLKNLTCKGNVQDCFDGLHGDGTGYVKIANSLFVGNSGAAIKGVNPTSIENSFIIDNCGYHAGTGLVYNDGHGDAVPYCRADSAVSLGVVPGVAHKIFNTTLFSNHDQTVSIFGSDCTGASVTIRNSIFQGGREFMMDTSNPYPALMNGSTPSGNDLTDSYYVYASGAPGTSCDNSIINEDYNTFFNSKDGAADVIGTHSYYRDPGLSATIKTGPYTSPGYYYSVDINTDFYLAITSNLRSEVGGANTALESTTCVVGDCALDYNYFARGAAWDTGAVEYGSTPTTAPSSSSSRHTAIGRISSSSRVSVSGNRGFASSRGFAPTQ